MVGRYSRPFDSILEPSAIVMRKEIPRCCAGTVLGQRQADADNSVLQVPRAISVWVDNRCERMYLLPDPSLTSSETGGPKTSPAGAACLDCQTRYALVHSLQAA